MKNQKLLKVLGIFLLAVIVLTWLIPGTTINSANVLERGTVNPTGLIELFPFDILMSSFWHNTVLIIFIGILYSVMNKTGAYKVLTDKLISKFKKNENIVLLISIAIFMIIPALTNIYMPLFVLVPFAVTLLIGLGFNKLTTLLATAGSVLIGISASLSNSAFIQISGVETNSYLWIKVAFLAVALVLTVLYAFKTSEKKKAAKKQEEEKEETIIVPLKRETKTKISGTPLLVIFSIMIFLMLLGLIQWKFELFANIHKAVMDVKIGEFKVFSNLFGTFSKFGSWYYIELFVVMAVTSVIIALVYKLNIKDFFDGVTEGFRKFAGIAVVTLLVNLFIIFTFNSGFLATIIDLLISSGNAALVTLTSIIGIPFVVDPSYVAQYNMGMISQAVGESANLGLNALINQLSYGVVMLVAPTSVMLVAGLMYLEANYFSWFKYIWKLAAILLIGVFIAITVASLI